MMNWLGLECSVDRGAGFLQGMLFRELDGGELFLTVMNDLVSSGMSDDSEVTLPAPVFYLVQFHFDFHISMSCLDHHKSLAGSFGSEPSNPGNKP